MQYIYNHPLHHPIKTEQPFLFLSLNSLTTSMASSVFSSPVQNRALLCFCFTFCYILFCLCFVSSVSSQSYACGDGFNASSFPFCDKSLSADVRLADLVQRLTLQEKITFLVDTAGNVSRLGIPNYRWWSEALHGVSRVGRGVKFTELVPGATSFPQPILTAASFNNCLFEAIGRVVSTEARAMYNVGLAGLTYWAPNINIFRDPRWGRGQETPGEDPLLTSNYGAGYVRGLQQTDSQDKTRLKVAACCKHYTAYDLDHWNSYDRYTFNAVVTQQDMEDTFQPPLKSCVLDGNAASVMCSYQQVNGKPTCADPDLLSGVIRGEWNLNGYIVTDCDSIDVYYNYQHYTKTPEEAAAVGILAGVDLDCGPYLGMYTEGAVEGGLVTEAAIDKAITNNFGTLMRLGFFDGDPSKQPYGDLGPKDVCTPGNQELARETARQGIVLLKNTPGSLPLSPTAIKSLAVIGPNGNVTDTMIGDYAGNPCNYTTPLQGLTAVVPTTFVAGCPDVACGTAQVDDATKLAAAADATVIIVGENQSIETESHDRTVLYLPGQQTVLVTEVAKASKGPVILVIMSGGGFDITFAKNDDKITSIVWVGYPGEAGGAAIADVIFGFYNPSGRLPMTWYPQAYVDNVPMNNMNMRPDPVSGYPGRTYRFYTGDTVYAFGYGMSYSNFSHSLVQAPNQVFIPLKQDHVCHSSSCLSLDVVKERCQNLAFDIHLGVKNLGKSGSHTVLLYSNPPSVHNAPNKHLVGFEKVFLGSQGEALVKFTVDVCKHLSVADELGNRKVALGDHILHVGDLKHTLSVSI